MDSVNEIVVSLSTCTHTGSSFNPVASTLPTFDFAIITKDDVIKANNDLPDTASCGVDNISSKMLKLCADIISCPLCTMLDSSIQYGIFPDVWKQALVTPVFKKGDKYDLKNYRPIALLCLVGKSFEIIICQQLTDFLEHNNCLSDVQHGFRRKRSCVSAPIRLPNILFSARRDKNLSYLVTIDFSWAFDSLNFNQLITALRECGVNEHACQWFTSYLTGRSQCTKYFGVLYDALPITSGVPQGSILGPVLFNIYLNRLLKLLPDDNAIAYADDLTLVCSNMSSSLAHKRMQSLLDLVQEWANAN